MINIDEIDKLNKINKIDKMNKVDKMGKYISGWAEEIDKINKCMATSTLPPYIILAKVIYYMKKFWQ